MEPRRCLGRALLAAALFLSACGPSGITVEEETRPAGPILGGCSSGPTTVAASFFNENPRTASGNSVLPFNSTLSSDYVSVGTLSGLTGNCLLQDPQFKVVEDDFFSNQIAVVTGNLIFGPTAPQFRQVNAFYHATGLRNFIANLGSSVTSMGTINLVANCNISSNAYFSPNANEVCLGYRSVGGGQIVWAADDGDVVVHEVGHGVNHMLATSQTMYSTGEAGALDEAIADYWAMTRFNSAKLGEWFLGAIGAVHVRDATENHSYPQDMAYQVHSDGRVISQALWTLRKAENLGVAITDNLVRTALTLLPATTRFHDYFSALETAAGPGFLNLTAGQVQVIRDTFQAKGIHRTDSAAGIEFGASSHYVIDDHSFSIQSGGNCNGQLDVGETVLVMMNLENTSAHHLGVVEAQLLAPLPSGVTIVSGGSWGEFFKFGPAGTFVDSLNSTVGNDRFYATLGASFLLRATSAGVKNFSVKITPMNTGLSRPVTDDLSVTKSFSLTVGTTATQSDCTNASLWP